jgi:tRNA-splicing ligase RtcB
VHRKGATAARKGQVGIIPGSMCTKSYIVTGKGDKDSFMSCSHGSGRNFSRKEAMRRIDSGIDASVENQLGDVMVFGSNDIRDEVSSAYKDITNVMKYQEDLVDIVHEFTPIAVLKG